MSVNQKIYAIRLQPGADLKKSLVSFASAKNIKAGYIITAVGSLETGYLRFAGQTAGVAIHGKFEILALSGTLSVSGIHLHISLADENGNTTGGHLLDGNIICTTAEIVIGEAMDLHFIRTEDARTGYYELEVLMRT